MKGPEEYDMDEGLMDELGGAMDDYDDKKVHPITVEITIHPQGKAAVEEEPESDEAMLPTPDELEEMMRSHS